MYEQPLFEIPKSELSAVPKEECDEINVPQYTMEIGTELVKTDPSTSYLSIRNVIIEGTGLPDMDFDHGTSLTVRSDFVDALIGRTAKITGQIHCDGKIYELDDPDWRYFIRIFHLKEDPETMNLVTSETARVWSITYGTSPEGHPLLTIATSVYLDNETYNEEEELIENVEETEAKPQQVTLPPKKVYHYVCVPPKYTVPVSTQRGGLDLPYNLRKITLKGVYTNGDVSFKKGLNVVIGLTEEQQNHIFDLIYENSEKIAYNKVDPSKNPRYSRTTKDRKITFVGCRFTTGYSLNRGLRAQMEKAQQDETQVVIMTDDFNCLDARDELEMRDALDRLMRQCKKNKVVMMFPTCGRFRAHFGVVVAVSSGFDRVQKMTLREAESNSDFLTYAENDFQL